MGSLPTKVYNLYDKQVIKTCLTFLVMSSYVANLIDIFNANSPPQLYDVLAGV